MMETTFYQPTPQSIRKRYNLLIGITVQPHYSLIFFGSFEADF